MHFVPDALQVGLRHSVQSGPMCSPGEGCDLLGPMAHPLEESAWTGEAAGHLGNKCVGTCPCTSTCKGVRCPALTMCETQLLFQTKESCAPVPVVAQVLTACSSGALLAQHQGHTL